MGSPRPQQARTAPSPQESEAQELKAQYTFRVQEVRSASERHGFTTLLLEESACSVLFDIGCVELSRHDPRSCELRIGGSSTNLDHLARSVMNQGALK
jgi:hypothetical protein